MEERCLLILWGWLSSASVDLQIWQEHCKPDEQLGERKNDCE